MIYHPSEITTLQTSSLCLNNLNPTCTGEALFRHRTEPILFCIECYSKYVQQTIQRPLEISKLNFALYLTQKYERIWKQLCQSHPTA